MVRSAGLFPATVLVVVAMLAWPWNLALSAIEGAHQRATAGPLVRARGLNAPGHRVNRPSRWGAVGTAALLQADTEEGEEGDDYSPLPWAHALDPVGVGSLLLNADVRPEWARGAARPRPGDWLCRLRC